MLKTTLTAAFVSAAALGLTACDVQKTQEGNVQVPKYEVSKTQEGSAQLPLGKKPLLVTDVDASPLPNGRLRLSFNERTPQVEKPRNFQIDLEPRLMQGLMHLLEQALTRSQWQVLAYLERNAASGSQRRDSITRIDFSALDRVRPS